jgi:GNAT superfamily N-acetyltransferase
LQNFEHKSFQTKHGRILQLRSATPWDAPALLDFDKATLTTSEHLHTSILEVTWPAEKIFKERIAKFQVAPNGLILMALVGSEVVGTLEFKAGHRRKTAHKGSFEMAVKREWRGQGIGALLMKELIEWVRTHATLEVVNLEVAEKNGPAVGLFRKMGFALIGRDAHATKTPEFGFGADLLMSLLVKKS